MTKNIVELINFKIKELQKNLLLLKQVSFDINKDNLKQDMLKYWGIERGLQICVECVIDIANIIISTTDLDKPDSYRETILTLFRLGVLPEKFAKQIVGMASFRNILVHDYLRVDEDVIIDVLKNKLDDFVKYINYVQKWMGENY